MNDNPYAATVQKSQQPFGTAIPVRPWSISVLAWLLILNTIRHAIVLWTRDGVQEIPLDALVLSLIIDFCYLLAGWGLLRMRKWAIPLYFAAHSITITKLIMVCPDLDSLFQQLASIRILWYLIIPIGFLAFAVPRWSRMSWA